MIRTLLCSTLALALLTAASVASAQDCPGCYGGHHGLGLHGYGRHHGGGLFHHGAMAGYYPNAVVNHGLPDPPRAWAGPGGCRTCAAGECVYRWYTQPDLFYNYYAWPSCSGLGAELYISPRPVPPHVGHTYITYQPFYPHEYMYAHHRTYHRYYNGGQGLTRTHVHYVAPLFRN